MRAQLLHLLERSRESHIDLRVLPFVTAVAEPNGPLSP
ncbi:Scr1 family TA system antitoxin-like transcriptional regulator [Streptomyces sp. NPDC021100]